MVLTFERRSVFFHHIQHISRSGRDLIFKSYDNSDGGVVVSVDRICC